MRIPLIAGNWKMYKTTNEAIELVNGIRQKVDKSQGVEVVVCPPFTTLAKVYDAISDAPIRLGAQDMYWEREGAFTSQVSLVMLKDCGCDFVIIGHSERRKYFHETNQTVNKKVKVALSGGLTPIVCVGEVLEEREAKKTLEVVSEQLRGGFKAFTEEEIKRVVIAYEPVWAIGTGKTATPDQAQEVHEFIRTWIKEAFSETAADTVRILYGGSIKPSNIKELMTKADVDGGLVGGASLKVDSFTEIIRNAATG